jgi:hypothetical protein
MHQANTITLSGRDALSQQEKKCLQILTVELMKSAVHCRQELTESDIRVYFESLRNRDPEAVRTAIVRCRETLSFLPKLSEILDRLSESRPAAAGPKRHVVRQWTEPFNATRQVRYFEYGDGTRCVAFEDVPTAGAEAQAGATPFVVPPPRTHARTENSAGDQQ